MAAGDLTTLANVKSYLGILGKPISAITKANPGQVTCTAHGLTTGLQVGLSGINGMTELNGTTQTVTVIDANNFTIGVNTSAYGTYTSSGYVSVDDPLLNRLITSVSDWIKSYCNRDFTQTTYTEYRNGWANQTKMALKNYPVSSVTSLYINGTLVPQSTAANVAGWVENGGFLYLRGGLTFTTGYANVVITYVAGYATIPYDLEQACIEITSWRYREKDRIAQANKNVGGENITFSMESAPKDAIRTLQEYTRVMQI
jgi:hypothetical protein